MSEPTPILGLLYLGDSAPLPILRATLTYEIPDTAPRVRSWMMVCRISPSTWRRFARQGRDRRRYNRARRKAVRAVLSGLAARPATRSPSEP